MAWRLKSRSLWLWEGDKNTKYFHRCENQRKNKNNIRKIQRCDRDIAYSTEEIQREVVNHLWSFFQKLS